MLPLFVRMRRPSVQTCTSFKRLASPTTRRHRPLNVHCKTIGACLADDEIADVPRPAKIPRTKKSNDVIEADISLMTGGSEKGVVNAGAEPDRNSLFPGQGAPLQDMAAHTPHSFEVLVQDCTSGVRLPPIQVLDGTWPQGGAQRPSSQSAQVHPWREYTETHGEDRNVSSIMVSLLDKARIHGSRIASISLQESWAQKEWHVLQLDAEGFLFISLPHGLSQRHEVVVDCEGVPTPCDRTELPQEAHLQTGGGRP